jgi:RES domain-containing protein
LFSIYRICRNIYIPQDPSGASQTTGRWHILSQRVLYFSSSLALCILELRANGVSFASIRREYHFTEIEIALEQSKINEVPESFYTKNWAQKINLSREFGSEWFRSAKSTILKMKSAVLPTDYNFILNTTHQNFSQLIFPEPKKIPLDARVK